MKTIAFQSDNFRTTEITRKDSPGDRTFLLGFIDLLMLNIAFWGIHWIKYRSFSLNPIHKELLVTISVLWLLTLLYSKKLSVVQHESFWTGIKEITRINLILIMLVSLMIISLRMMEASRIQAYGSCLVFYLLEVMGYLMLYRWVRSTSPLEAATESVKPERDERSFILFTLAVPLLFLSFLLALYIKKGTLLIGNQHIDYILTLYTLWVTTSIMTNKYCKTNLRHINVWLPANIKSTILMLGGATIIVFGTRFFDITRLLIFGPILFLFLLESIVFYICHLYFKCGGDVRDLEDVQEIMSLIAPDRIVVSEKAENAKRVVTEPVAIKLKHALEFLDPGLLDFINENIDISSIDRTETALLSADNIFNVRSLDQERMRLFVNLHKLNDMRWFNQYFLSVHTKLVTGGYLVGHVHTIETHKMYFHGKYPRYIGVFVSGLHFLWNRVMPKLPWTQKVYYALTKGRNRIVSKAEAFGRLYFCGFKIVAERVMKDRLFFIAQKVKAPSLDTNPTYGPIIRLKRFCGGGNHLIIVYKFRTMYPYSEYLQEYVYERNKLEKGGKFKDDFRVTAWGKFLRKTWLDELPMLYNWLKGDLQLIGVRPLSNQYLSLYDPRVRQLREKAKPGLIPPFYADLPDTLEKIQESETRYIESYLQRPFLTQLTYLYKSIFNILINNARSA